MKSNADVRVARIAERQFGAVGRAQAFQAGFTADTIHARLKHGLWVAVHRGVYRLAGVRPCVQLVAMCACLAVPGGVVSHRMAACLWGLEGVRLPTLPDILICCARRSWVPGITIHRTRVLSRLDRTKLGPIPITTVRRTIFDLATCVHVTVLEQALDDALRRKLVSLQVLRRDLDSRPARGRQGISVLRSLIEAREAAGGLLASVLESRMLRLLATAGLPTPRAQHRVVDDHGALLGRVDLAYPDVRLGIELQSDPFHAGRIRGAKDRARHNALTNHDWDILYFAWDDVHDKPLETCRSVAAPLGATLTRSVERKVARIQFKDPQNG